MHNLIPLIALTFTLGVCASYLVVPAIPMLCIIAVSSLLTIALIRKSIIVLLATFLFGLCYMSLHIHNHLAHSLADELENKPLKISGTIKSVVEVSEKKSQFIFNVTKPEIAAKSVRLSWYNAPKSLSPGDEWQLTVRLKQPHGYANPGSFDLEKFCFSERISALGSVVVNKHADNRLLSKSWNINRMRQNLLEKLVTDSPYSGIVAALLLGIKSKITPEQNQVFQNTGTAHLMAISGLHVGMVAAIVFFLLRILWRFVPVGLLSIPAPWLAAWGALFASVIYALLAGFSIATQRALIMVVIMLSGLLLRRKTSIVHTYFIAIIAVLLWDPFAVLSVGFWLSFAAVGCLMYAFVRRTQLSAPWRWLMPQLVILCGLLPLSIIFFQQSSIVAPIANLLAIPWVGFTVVPFCLLGLTGIAEFNLGILWPVLEFLAKYPIYNWHLPSDYLYLRLACAAFGFFWLFAPRGIPGRIWGILGFLPLLFVQMPQVPYATAEFALLDVGQGLSAVVRTQQHTLVYDTGTPGIGKQVIAPYLRVNGIHKIDMLMISHADNDHIGGAASLLDLVSTDSIITSDPSKIGSAITCHAGQHWQWDGVDFMVLHPSIDYISKKKNDQSCVLLVSAGEHRILLTGDIEAKAEQQLVTRYGDDLRANVLLVPHHGSRTSSSEVFLDHVQPQLAIIPVGYLNRYGHPKQQIVDRYFERNIPVYTTDVDGAISLSLGKNLHVSSFRGTSKQFWRH